MEMDGVPARVYFAVVAVVLLLLTAGCSLVRSHRSDAEPRDVETNSSTQQPPSDGAAPAPQPDAATAPVTATGAPAAAPQAGVGTTSTPAQPVPPPTPAPRGKSAPPPTTKRPAAPAPNSAAPVTKAPVRAAPLDLNGLKQELKDTKAIGVFS